MRRTPVQIGSRAEFGYSRCAVGVGGPVMDYLRAFIAAAIFVPLAAALPVQAVAQAPFPLQQLSDLSDQARAADEAHAQAARVCDTRGMQRELNTLNRLAREAQQIADAARDAGPYAAIDPLNAARIAATIATRARVAARRPPENCPEPEEQMRQQPPGPPGTTTGTQPPAPAPLPPPPPPPVRRAPTVDDALNLNFEHAKAADRCDREAMARLLAALERLTEEAEMEMHSADGPYTRSLWEIKSNTYSEILRILRAARERQARGCPDRRQWQPGQPWIRLPRLIGPNQRDQRQQQQQGAGQQQEKQQQGTVGQPQQQQQEQQQEAVEERQQRDRQQLEREEQQRRKQKQKEEEEQEEEREPDPGMTLTR
jgi:hypothetical protein